jgi:hypothetical protein
MIASAWVAVLLGAAAGACVGAASRFALKRVLGSCDQVFFSVFGAGMLVRLALVAGAVCLLRHEKYIIIILFAVAMIVVQTLFEAFPLKKNGPERNS